MPTTTYSYYSGSKPAGGVIKVDLPQGVLNANRIYIRELKVATTATPFLIKLRSETGNESILNFADLGEDGVFASSGPQINQIWHQQFESPGLLVGDKYGKNVQAGSLHFKVMNERNADFTWSQLFIRFQIEYDEIPNSRDPLNWNIPPQPVTHGNGSRAWGF